MLDWLNSIPHFWDSLQTVLFFVIPFGILVYGSITGKGEF